MDVRVSVVDDPHLGSSWWIGVGLSLGAAAGNGMTGLPQVITHRASWGGVCVTVTMWIDPRSDAPPEGHAIQTRWKGTTANYLYPPASYKLVRLWLRR